MSDPFTDLWAASAPAKSTHKQPQKQLAQAVQRRPQYDAFSILSASQPSNRPIVNNQLADRRGRQPPAASHNGDAFSTLFTSSLDCTAASRNSDRANMTMAERAALTQQGKAAQDGTASIQISSAPASSSLWDGLDTLARPTSCGPSPPTSGPGNTTVHDGSDFGFDGVSTIKGVSFTTSPQNDVSIQNDDWGLSEFSSPSASRPASAPTKPASESNTGTLCNLDEFGSSEPQMHRIPQVPSRSLTGTPGDFDFGDRDDGLLTGEDSGAEDTFGIRSSHAEHHEDDILGDLGKPVSYSHSPSPNLPTLTGVPIRPPRTSASPPPHITGQLVEMGFSPLDARAALTNTMTEDGYDAQAAAELLLSQMGQEGSTPPSHSSERERRRDRDSNGERVRAARPPPPTRTNPRTQSSTSQTHQKSQQQPQLEVTAEKLLSQASEIGRGMFSKANALWKEGKERAVKMYEERAAVAGSATGTTASDSRPRWMRDHATEWKLADQTDGYNVVQAGFRDAEDEGQGREQREREQRHPARRLPSELEREREVDLFSTDAPATAYQSPFRRGKPQTTAPLTSTQSSLSTHTYMPSIQATVSTSPTPSTSQRPPQPPRTFTTTITLSALTASASHKSTGTDAYKRGDFPVALAAYIRALSALPSGHILRVPILTNVALAQSKVGELRETVKACEEAVVVIQRFVGGANRDGGSGGEVNGISFAEIESKFDEKIPMEVGSGKVSISVQGGGGGAPSNGDLSTSIDLVEGLSKAFKRRADALEGLEKWEMARCTWEALLGVEWAAAGVKGDAIKGLGRCRRMINGSGAGPSAPPKPKPDMTQAHPKPKPKPNPSASPSLSAALTALRSTHDAQQSEDIARLACKDSVEARLTAWKNGREGNIRALLTSLDETVLWPELGWRKVGMAEVVSKGQVKGAYVRAIARVHPDKLNAGNTTVEQRMIANGVFGALNEAWNVFQRQ